MSKTADYVLLNAKAATGLDKIAFSEDFEFVNMTVDTINSANFTIKFATSDSENPPNFTAAQSVSNSYDYQDVIDLEDGSSIDGDTGVSASGTDDHRRFQLNTSAARWCAAIITTYTAGNITVKARLFNHNE